MQITIQENQCVDQEIRILDTRLPYFFNTVKESFLHGPSNVVVEVVKECGEGVSCVCGNKILILEPNKFEEKGLPREDFYKILYRELMTMFYSDE